MESNSGQIVMMNAMMTAQIRQYLDLIRFSHTLFALPFALLGAALAAHGQDGWHGRLQDWVGILVCMATARSAAMAFNRLADRHFDALNPRTASRHLPAGFMSVRSVALFTHLLAGVRRRDFAVPSQSLAAVSRHPGVALASGILLQQAFTSLAHFWLGVSLSLAPIAAWIALRGISNGPRFCWRWPCCSGSRGLISFMPAKMSSSIEPSTFGAFPRRLGSRALWIAAACHALMIVPLVGLGLVYPLGPIYFVGVAAVAALLIYEHAWSVPTT